jgi:hypothetical protein
MFEFQQILKHGIFYFPAHKHYNRQLNVVCDRCRTQQLTACIGHGQQDLCLICANELTRNVSHHPVPPNTSSEIIYNPNPFVNPNDYFSDYKKC